MTALGQRIRAFRAERALQQRQLAEKAGLSPSMLSQIESGRLTPSLPTLGKLAGALGVSIGSLFEPAPTGRLHVSRKADYPVVSFDGSSEKWHVLGAGLFQGKIRAVMSTLGPRSRGVKTDKVVIEAGQMRQRLPRRRHRARLGERGIQDREGPLGHPRMTWADRGSTRPRWPTVNRRKDL